MQWQGSHNHTVAMARATAVPDSLFLPCALIAAHRESSDTCCKSSLGIPAVAEVTTAARAKGDMSRGDSGTNRSSGWGLWKEGCGVWQSICSEEGDAAART